MLAEQLDSIDYNNIILCEPTKNSIIQHSNFYKILYSNKYLSFNGIYGIFKLNKINILKDRAIFNITNNKETLEYIYNLENYLLNLIDVSKNKIHKIREFLNNGFIKYGTNDIDLSLFDNTNYDILAKNISDSRYFILKISGLWETKDNLGITFKIILVNKYIQM